MGSSRFPGKPLALIGGRPMIEHVYRRSALCPALGRLVVATPDKEIAEAVWGFGGEAVMTSLSHVRATDRVVEATLTAGGDVIVMVQGDEPLVRPEMIDAAVGPVLEDGEIFCTNLVERIKTIEEFRNPNTIKVTMDRRMNALYFSREPVPNLGDRRFEKVRAYKQVCIMAFRRERLMRFPLLEPTALEEAESIDMLRLLEHGFRVRLVESPCSTHAVDSPGDIALVEEVMAKESYDPVLA
jgi:3-deoxy-manno-octulosonate cytidylyltransferase (CMP-KDO synthetase)